MSNKIESEYIPAQRFADLMLDIGTYLLSSGAHCGRVNTNLSRIAETWDFDINIDPTFKGLLIKVRDRNNPDNTVTTYRQAPPHNVHLAILTKISHLSWKTYDQRLNINEVESEFKKVCLEHTFSNWQIAIAVGLSCAGLCLFSDGDIYNALVAMVAASLGFGIRVKLSNLRFNAMLSIGTAAFWTTLITCLGAIFNIGSNPEAAMATAVLYLIPGVPLINCVIDLIDGYLSSAVNRALFSGFILLCISAGMTLCITLLGVNNFI